MLLFVLLETLFKYAFNDINNSISHFRSLFPDLVTYMSDDYDSSKPSKYIQYFGANNLYGWAMLKPLPTHGFKWMNEEELENWRSFSCILEVDLEYPENLQDLHSDYPLAVERLKVGKVDKLAPNLKNKQKYVIHHAALKQCERLGLKITIRFTVVLNSKNAPG